MSLSQSIDHTYSCRDGIVDHHAPQAQRAAKCGKLCGEACQANHHILPGSAHTGVSQHIAGEDFNLVGQ